MLQVAKVFSLLFVFMSYYFDVGYLQQHVVQGSPHSRSTSKLPVTVSLEAPRLQYVMEVKTFHDLINQRL